jgi:hypothetical protein
MLQVVVVVRLMHLVEQELLVLVVEEQDLRKFREALLDNNMLKKTPEVEVEVEELMEHIFPLVLVVPESSSSPILHKYSKTIS